jgi:hypothetical protein
MKLKKENHAVAGVIEALLMVALIAVVISIIQLQYIPQIMEQKEADHMDAVSNQFSSLKAMVDVQAITGSMKSDVPLSYVPMSTQITLGSRELPYFITAPSYGEINIEENEARISAQPPIVGPHSSGILFSALVYHAYNCYFVEQSYIFEGGGIILNQSSGNSTMRADPSISVTETSNEIKVKFYLPNITAVEGKDHTEGYGSCYIRTNYSTSYNASYYPNDISSDYIYIQSRYIDAWNESLNRSFAQYMTIKKGYVMDQGKSIEVVKITPRYKKIRMDITVVDIYCQIGPGWVI